MGEENKEGMTERLLKTYKDNDDFQLVQTPASLQAMYADNDLDPKTLDPNIFAIESLAHFLQDGLEDLFRDVQITKESRVLSVGEGNGAPSRLLLKSIGPKLTAVDLNPDQVKNAQGCMEMHGLDPNLIDFNIQDVHKLDLGEKTFDRAYFNETICHWENHGLAFERISKHIESGGIIGANLWLKGDKADLNQAEHDVPEYKGFYQPDIWNQATFESLSKAWEDAGFEIILQKDYTDEVDAKLRKRIKELMVIRNYTKGKAGHEFAIYGIDYYNAMLLTHGPYLKYGRLVARKK